MLSDFVAQRANLLRGCNISESGRKREGGEARAARAPVALGLLVILESRLLNEPISKSPRPIVEHRAGAFAVRLGNDRPASGIGIPAELPGKEGERLRPGVTLLIRKIPHHGS